MKHIARAPWLVVFAYSALTSGWLVGSSQAQDRQPTPLQCECMLTHGGYQTNTNVDNASLCVQQIDDRKCRVTVHCLVTGQGPGCEARSQTEEIASATPEVTTNSFGEIDHAAVDPEVTRQIVEVLVGVLNVHLEFQTDPDLPVEDTQREARQLLEDRSVELLACAQQFAGRLTLPEFALAAEQYVVLAETLSDRRFFCGVDAVSGWLQIGLSAAGRTFQIQVAPTG